MQEELQELRNELVRHHRDFDRISRIMTLVREGKLTAEQACKLVQNIVG
jgi:hypothetical protein